MSVFNNMMTLHSAGMQLLTLSPVLPKSSLCFTYCD